jgi:eukaryotic-like serine/threonine-protein kinase
VGEPDDVPRGTTIRRFVVLERIGAGAMGTVYTAYDYALERKLALKLVRGDGVLGEAQALAKLTHPNVVAVYDVGTYGDRVYIAMEYVAGGTLRAWLAETHSLADKVAMLVEAGRGLAAAHAAGIVHGDFKPENVLVDGARCVVADFGLAMRAGESARGCTPAYAAPDAEPTPASDQFSFCVTAYEALYGERPHAGNDETTVASAIAAGALRPAPSRSRVPARLRAAIVRGLAVASGERWPSMRELLAALSPNHTRRNRVLVAGAVTAAAALGVGATMFVRAEPGPSCAGGDEQASAVWTPARRAALKGRLPPAVFERVAGKLDGYTHDWAVMHGAACRATRALGTQSEALLDLRMECLRRRLGEVDAEIDALGGVTERELPTRAVDAVHALVPLAGCADAASLQAPSPLPADRARLAALTDRFAKTKALYDTGRDREALVAARALSDDTAALGYRPLEAEALHLRGRLEYLNDNIAASELTLEHAIAAAEAGNAREALVRSWLELVWVIGEMSHRFEEGERLGVIARGAIERAGNTPESVALLEDHLGVIAFDAGQFTLAKTRLEHALAIRSKTEDVELAAVLQHLAYVRDHDGDEAGALAMNARAVKIMERELGDDHASTGQVLGTLAASRYDAGDLDGAIADWRHALAIAERTHGPHALDAASVRISIALALRDKGQLAEALEQSAIGAADFVAVAGETDPEAPGYITNHGYILMAAGRYDEATAEMERARDLVLKWHGSDRIRVADALVALGKVKIAAGAPRAAIEPLERALQLRQTANAGKDVLAASRIQLAEALWKSGADRARARQLASEARGDAPADWRARADALLAAK